MQVSFPPAREIYNHTGIDAVSQCNAPNNSPSAGLTRIRLVSEDGTRSKVVTVFTWSTGVAACRAKGSRSRMLINLAYPCVDEG